MSSVQKSLVTKNLLCYNKLFYSFHVDEVNIFNQLDQNFEAAVETYKGVIFGS